MSSSLNVWTSLWISPNSHQHHPLCLWFCASTLLNHLHLPAAAVIDGIILLCHLLPSGVGLNCTVSVLLTPSSRQRDDICCSGFSSHSHVSNSQLPLGSVQWYYFVPKICRCTWLINIHVMSPEYKENAVELYRGANVLYRWAPSQKEHWFYPVTPLSHLQHLLSPQSLFNHRKGTWSQTERKQ